MSIILIVYVTCVALGIMAGLYIGVNMWFDLKVALPLITEYDGNGRLAAEWSGGKLISRVKIWVYARCFMFALVFVVMLFFVNLPGAFCYLFGLAVPIMIQGSRFDRYNREIIRSFQQKYAKYIKK